MPFDHERLDVYQVALDFFDLTDEIIENLPHGRRHLARASLAVLNDITEGADVSLRRKRITEQGHRTGKQLLDLIVAMLVKLASLWPPGSGTGSGSG